MKISQMNIDQIVGHLDDKFNRINKVVCPKCSANALRKLYTEQQELEQKVGTKLIILDRNGVGCCQRCAKYSGYFDDDVSINDFGLSYDNGRKFYNKLKEKYNFDKKYGFFDIKHMTCGLPRKYRSIICLTYCCEPVQMLISPTGKDFYVWKDAIRKRLKELRTLEWWEKELGIIK